MLAGTIERGKTEVPLGEAGYKVVAVMFFGKREVARFPTREQAEWRAKELNEHSERNPRGYVQYLVQPVEERPKNG
jgi:hypothetical protein